MSDRGNYDVMLNCGELGYENCARIICEILNRNAEIKSSYQSLGGEVTFIETYLAERRYPKDVRAVIYKNVGHLTGMMPNREREKRLYCLLPFIGLMYKSVGRHRKECLAAIEDEERMIIDWIFMED